MRTHLSNLTITDPTTGRTYPVPAGGSTDEPNPDIEGTTDETAATADDDGADDEQDGTTDTDDTPLGEAGQKALREERKARRAAEKQAAELARQLEAAAQTNTKTTEDDSADVDALVKQARAEAEAEVAARYAKQIAASRLETAARDVLTDPADAAIFINIDEVLDTEGNVDSAAMADALTELVERKPHLAKKAAAPKRDGLPGQGVHQPATGGKDIQDFGVEDFLKSMTSKSA